MPAIAFSVEGLRESVLDGWLIALDSVLADAIDPALCAVNPPDDEVAWTDRSPLWRSVFPWVSSAERMAGVVLHELDAARRRSLTNQPTVTTIRTVDPQTLTAHLRTQQDPTHQLAIGEGTAACLLEGRDNHWIAHMLTKYGDAEFTIPRASDHELLVGSRTAPEQIFGGSSRV